MGGLTVLEAGSLKSWYQQGHAPSEGSGEGSVPVTLLASGGLRCSLVCRCISPILSSHDVLPVSFFYMCLCSNLPFVKGHQAY